MLKFPAGGNMRLKMKPGKGLPTEYIIPNLPPVWYDQETINSCVGQALSFCVSYYFYKATGKVEMFSPMFLYWHARYLRGLTAKDEGAYLIDGITALVRWGCCREAIWAHTRAHLTVQPSPEAYEDTMSFALTAKYAIINMVEDMKQALIHQVPVVFGFPVPESFKRSLKGEVFLYPPQPNDRILGGHAVVAVGYSDSKTAFLCRNSWGREWGDDGNFWIHYDYFGLEFTNPQYGIKVERRKPRC
jgi:hypothetical protein